MQEVMKRGRRPSFVGWHHEAAAETYPLSARANWGTNGALKGKKVPYANGEKQMSMAR